MGIMATSQRSAGCECRTRQKEETGSDDIHFFFPLGGLANTAGSICPCASPRTEKSLAARSCSVPPHFNPRAASSHLSFSRPSISNSATQLNASKSTDSCTISWGGGGGGGWGGGQTTTKKTFKTGFFLFYFKEFSATLPYLAIEF